jgi:hypothetical protein
MIAIAPHRSTPALRRLARRSAVIAAVLYLVLAGTATAVTPAPLTTRLLKAGDLAGMKRGPAVVAVVHNATVWAQGNAAEAKLLKRGGFVAAVAESLVTPGNSNRYGLSFVVELSSHANARVALDYDTTTNGPWTRFDVPGVPGAVGFERLTSTEGGRNIAFSIGPYVYLVGVGWLGGNKNAVPRSDVISAAQIAYKRAH